MTTEWSRMPETMLRQAALRQAILDAASPVQWIPTDRKQWHCAHGGRFFCVRGEGQSFTLWETGDEGVVLSYAERKAESWNEVNRYVLEAVGELPRSASELLCDAWRELARGREARASRQRLTMKSSVPRSAVWRQSERSTGSVSPTKKPWARDETRHDESRWLGRWSSAVRTRCAARQYEVQQRRALHRLRHGDDSFRGASGWRCAGVQHVRTCVRDSGARRAV